MKLARDLEFWSASALILVTVLLMIGAYLRWFQLSFFVGAFRFSHWLAWIGTSYIAIVVPAYYFLKRRYPKTLRALVRIHVFGNLLAFMLISVHFAQQIGRPRQFYPDLGTGLALYIVMLLLTSTGFFQRFKIVQSLRPHLNRFTHISITLSFYTIIGIHILQGLGVL